MCCLFLGMGHLIGCDRPGGVFGSGKKDTTTILNTPEFLMGRKKRNLITSGTCALGPGDRRPFLIGKKRFHVVDT